MVDFQFYRYFRPETQVWEQVAPWPWEWEVIYMGGKSLKQQDDTGIFHQLREIDLSDKFVFIVHSKKFDRKFYYFINPVKQKFKYFFRRTVIEGVENVIYVFAYKLLDSEVWHNHVITPSGDLLITDDLNNLEF